MNLLGNHLPLLLLALLEGDLAIRHLRLCCLEFPAGLHDLVNDRSLAPVGKLVEISSLLLLIGSSASFTKLATLAKLTNLTNLTKLTNTDQH